ncbi:leucine rich repeat domain containing protein [Acanthamoeba castellanii str. Neff]|uniref:Leucine rich repeat domain containing protein n=1 Tax=Acanthamoeba castellanii (strain ATCC 30010 / Neff) TaxID=1257118 RepID=L8GXF6_ACACF|nr:leucine rich repeat domain containing protein [Acanthamoeba castellanii str. Neff]ELR17665.1 leucine rich repeat domain containing protein [Acanthamoeba castellanii str. Neff]
MAALPPLASSDNVVVAEASGWGLAQITQAALRAVGGAWRAASGGGDDLNHSNNHKVSIWGQQQPRPLVVALAAVATVGAVGGAALLLAWVLRRRTSPPPPPPRSSQQPQPRLSQASTSVEADLEDGPAAHNDDQYHDCDRRAVECQDTMNAEPMKPADFVSCPPLPLNCAIITLAGERNRDHVVLPLRLELLSEKTADDLQVLNDSLFPIKYNRRLYDILLRTPELSCLAYYGDTLVGASSSRVEPISDSEDEDDESEERPGEAEIQKHKMANYYVMTLGVLGPYRRKGVGGQLLRHAFDDCHRVEKETAKRAEEKKRREEERRQTAPTPIRTATATTKITARCAMRINDVYIHIASKSGREVEFYKRHGFEMTRIDRDYYRRVEPPDALVFSKNYAHYQVEQQLLKDNPTSGADAVGSLKDMLGKWVSQNWTAMESQLAVLPADLRAWLLNYLTVNSLLVDPLLHILAPDSAATRLDLSWCKSVTETGLQGIGEACPQIQQLMLRGTSIRFSPFLKSLKHFPFVHSINLDLCPDIEDKDVVSIITSLGRNLRSISLAGCVKVLRAPSYLTPYPTLRSLVIAFDGLKANASLGSGAQVSEQAVEKLVTECPNLENVSLSGCDRITDASLECLSSLTKLQQLDISWCRQLTNVEPLSACRHLSVLNLDGCWNVSGRRFMELCSSVLLTVLSIDECGGIRRKHLSWCAQNQRFAALRSLTLSGFSKLHDEDLTLLVKSADQLMHLVLWATDFSEALLQQLADAYPRIEIEAFSNMIDPEGGSSHRTTAAQ